MKKTAALVLICIITTVIVIGCTPASSNNEPKPAGNNNDVENINLPSEPVEPPETAADVGAEAIFNDISWFLAYSAILNGDNALGIDFLNYRIGDESDVSAIRSYRGCGLYDVDCDGIPELFIEIGLWEGRFYHVFTAEGDTGIYIGDVRGRYIEKPTGYIFNAFDEAGYAPDIAYEYKNNSIVEIPGYAHSIFYYTEYPNLKVALGSSIYAFESPNIACVECFRSLEEAAGAYALVKPFVPDELSAAAGGIVYLKHSLAGVPEYSSVLKLDLNDNTYVLDYNMFEGFIVIDGYFRKDYVRLMFNDWVYGSDDFSRLLFTLEMTGDNTFIFHGLPYQDENGIWNFTGVGELFDGDGMDVITESEYMEIEKKHRAFGQQ